MCANYDVIITEDYAERMTVPKGEMDSKARNALLERMGDICNSQGQYQLATRKYTQAGKLVKAMRALLKGKWVITPHAAATCCRHRATGTPPCRGRSR